jgi:SWI/SNF-related matrix-associated actin-dependent regulator of chromatin subfamily A member 5
MLHKVLRPFMLRRLKADVEKSLPPKQETILFTGLSEMQRELYKKILRREVDLVNGETSSSRTALLNIVMQLRKVKWAALLLILSACLPACLPCPACN